MDFDEIILIWRHQNAETPPLKDTDEILAAVEALQPRFTRMILRRDVGEIAASVILAGFFGYLATAITGAGAFLGAAAAACLWVGVFLVVDRVKRRHKSRTPGMPLKASLEAWLAETNHQIWLLKNVFWWYLLPLALGYAMVPAFVAWQWRTQPVKWQLLPGGMLALGGLVFYFIYRLNQNACRNQLLPIKAWLEELLAGLGEDASAPGPPAD